MRTFYGKIEELLLERKPPAGSDDFAAWARSMALVHELKEGELKALKRKAKGHGAGVED